MVREDTKTLRINPTARRGQISGSFGSLSCRQIISGVLDFRHYILDTHENCYIEYRLPKSFLHIAITGNYLYGKVPIREGQYLFLVIPQCSATLYYEGGSSYEWFDIACPSAHFKKYSLLFPYGKQFLQHQIRDHKGDCVANMSISMKLILQEILKNSYPVHLQKAFLQIKFAELMFRIFLQRNIGESVAERLTEREINSLHEVKKLIEDNYSEHYTIPRMAKKAGMNTTSFKSRFRQQFGMAPYAYLYLTRMQKAREFLKDPRLSIHQVAYETGYHSFSSFIKAIKRKYGVTPGQLRKIPG